MPESLFCVKLYFVSMLSTSYSDIMFISFAVRLRKDALFQPQLDNRCQRHYNIRAEVLFV